jgi:hypothetical protein
LEQQGYRAFALVDGSGLDDVTAEQLRVLQSKDRLERKLANPRYSGYVNNVVFVPSEQRSVLSFGRGSAI